jgi:hypothetical protein
MLAGLTSGFQRNVALADKLKADTAKVMGWFGLGRKFICKMQSFLPCVCSWYKSICSVSCLYFYCVFIIEKETFSSLSCFVTQNGHPETKIYW